MRTILNRAVLFAKRIVYGRSGEPFEFGGVTLRFKVGTRPVRSKYRNSNNTNVRCDAIQVELVKHVLNEGDAAIDVGAHAGQYGVLMAARCGASGYVACFEPDPSARALLEENLGLNPSLPRPQVIEAACSASAGRATFFTQGGNSQSSLAKSALPTDRKTRQIDVEMIKLDDWWEEHRNGWPNLVKIDTEGAEIDVLRGMKRILESNAVVICELHPFAWDEFGVGVNDLRSIAEQANRRIRWIDGEEEIGESVHYGTVVLEKCS